MNEVSIGKRLLALIGILAGAFAVFAIGLALLNVRNDLVFALGVVLAILGPLGGALGLWRMLSNRSAT